MPVDSRERGMGECGVRPGETARAARTGAVEVDAHRLERTVRAAATASVDEGEFCGGCDVPVSSSVRGPSYAGPVSLTGGEQTSDESSAEIGPTRPSGDCVDGRLPLLPPRGRRSQHW